MSRERIESVRQITNSLKKYDIDNTSFEAIRQLKEILLEYIINGKKINTSIHFTEFNKWINVKLYKNVLQNKVVISLNQ